MILRIRGGQIPVRERISDEELYACMGARQGQETADALPRGKGQKAPQGRESRRIPAQSLHHHHEGPHSGVHD